MADKPTDPIVPAPAPDPVSPLVAAKNIPTIESEALPPDVATSFAAPLISDYKGVYINSVDGEPYALAVKEDAPDGKTHFLMNSKHFDNCTRQEFKARYEKK